MKRLGARFLLPFGILGILFAVFLVRQTYVASRNHANELVAQQTALALEFNLAIRDYAGKKIRPVMEGMLGKDAFVAETMSTSFISRNVFEAVRKKFPDSIIRFASDHPRNPINAASPDELRMIEYFRKNPSIDRRIEELQIDGKRYLAHFTPRWLEMECMRCHGSPADAPAALIRRYGATAGFHRTLGDVAALDVVAVPLEKVQSSLSSEMRRQVLILTVGLTLLFGSVIATFRFVVTRRVTKMAKHFHAIATHAESSRLTPVAVTGNDEISTLGSAFNTLVEELRATHGSLEQRVSQRTAELASTNAELKREIADRQRAEEALADRTRQLESVRTITAEITRELDLAAALRLITQRACELTDASGGDLYLWDGREQELVPEAAHGTPTRWERIKRRLGQGVMGAVAQRREGLLINHYRASPLAHPHTLAQTGITAVLTEPLLYGDRLLGVIGVHHETEGRVFTDRDQATLRLFAAQAAIVIENARLFDAQQHAFSDLQRAQDELVRDAKLRALGQMATGIAHDLNNMLAAILGQVDLLKLRGATPEMRDGLDTLQTAATDGAHVVRRLQDFARQRVSSPLAPVDLREIVKETLEITRPRWKDEAQRRGQRIEVHTALEPLPVILGHAPEIREVLTNLIFNAVDAMPDGGTLTFTGTSTPEGAVLCVTDSGMGMTDEIRQRIFEPFFTTKGVRGSGLGLSVVYGIMERHGGHIEVTSSPGRGTTIALRFQVASEGKKSDRQAAPAFVLRTRRILVIDDESMVRTTLAGLLRALGHTVTEAEGGQAGLAALAANSVELVLTDLGMPEMTGWEVARAIKAQRPRLPVVLLTGWGEQALEGSTDRAAVDRILGKPVRLEDLLKTIAELTPATVAES
jgi:signal transduction histidine kinase/ActR/RegA family two-component response regulator/HAMP domain-containing protein